MKNITLGNKEYKVGDETYEKIVEMIKNDPAAEEAKEMDYMDFMFGARRGNNR